MRYQAIIVIILVLIFAVPTKSYAGEPWDNTDKVLYTLDLAVTLMDYKQTMQIAREGPDTNWNVYETNPILGKHPTEQEVTIYFVGREIMKYYIADYLKPSYRKIFLIASFFATKTLVQRNLTLGLRF